MIIVGLDEAGIGCIAGPLVMAASAFEDSVVLPKLVRDSKTLSHDQREGLVDNIYDLSEWVIIMTAQASYINASDGVWSVWDHLLHELLTVIRGKLWADELGRADKIIVDGTRLAEGFSGVTYEAKADKKYKQVSAASIIAKYVQTSAMEDLHERAPQYEFDKHHGYGTPVHMRALQEYGPLPDHRAHYKPVRKAIKALPAERRQALKKFPDPVTMTIVEGGTRDA